MFQQPGKAPVGLEIFETTSRSSIVSVVSSPARSANSIHSTPAPPHFLASASKIHPASRMRISSLTRHKSSDLLDGHCAQSIHLPPTTFTDTSPQLLPNFSLASRASSSQSHADCKYHVIACQVPPTDEICSQRARKRA